jgi:FXSXX-COOH protein
VDDTPVDLATDLADLTDVLLDDLRTADDTPLAHSIRRILAESKDGTNSVVAGHETHI